MMDRNHSTNHHKTSMYCKNPFCCPIPGCELKHDPARVLAKELYVCEFFPKCYDLDCRDYHPTRIPMILHDDPVCRTWGCSFLHRNAETPQKCYEIGCKCPDKRHRPVNDSSLFRLCEDVLCAITQFLTFKEIRAMYSSSYRLRQHIQFPVLETSKIRYFKRNKSIYWEPCEIVSAKNEPYSYWYSYFGKVRVSVVAKGMDQVHHHFFIYSYRDWNRAFSRDPVFPMWIASPQDKYIQLDLGYRSDIRPKNIQKGLRVDVMDPEGIWYEAVIADRCGDRVKIHFIGWDPVFDTWMAAMSPNIATHHHFTPRWRENIQKGHCLYFRHRTKRWHRGRVSYRCDHHIRIVSDHPHPHPHDPHHDPHHMLETTIFSENVSLPGSHVPDESGKFRYRLQYSILSSLDRWPSGDRRMMLSCDSDGSFLKFNG